MSLRPTAPQRMVPTAFDPTPVPPPTPAVRSRLVTILTAYLVPAFDYGSADFGEGDMYNVGQNVAGFLKKSTAASSKFQGVDFSWEGRSADVGQNDLVCYVFGDISQSIVDKHRRTHGPMKSDKGNTVWSPKAQRMISEIYIAGCMKYSANLEQRDRVISIAIIHEFMHNKLDLYPFKRDSHGLKPGFVADLHATTGKAASQGIAYYGGLYDDDDVALMAAGIEHEIPQYTKEMVLNPL